MPIHETRYALSMMRRLTMMLAAVLFLVPATAQRTKIFGTVRDENGLPIELANVRVVGTTNITATNFQGNYTLYTPSRDSVLVIYSMIGYNQRRRLLRNPGDSIHLDVTLSSTEASFGEAVVKGIGLQTTTEQRISMTDANTTPSLAGNGVEEIIQTQAGVSTHNEMSSQYNVRGGSFDENVVYLNGMEVYRPMLVRSGQQEGLSVINQDMVERIGFSSGGFEARYGDKMSSVLDITYKRPEQWEGRIYASLLGAGAYMGWGNSKVSLMTSLRYKTTGYLLGTLDTDAEYNPHFLDYQAFLSWRPNKRWSIDLIGNISDNHYNFVPHSRETKFGTIDDAKSFKVYFDGQEKDRFKTLLGALSLTRHFNAETFLALQLSAFGTTERETFDIAGEYWLQEATAQERLGIGTYMEHARNRLQANVMSAALRFRTRLGKAGADKSHTLQAGVKYNFEKVRERSTEWEMRDSMGFSLPYSLDELKLIYSLKSENEVRLNRIEAFVQDSWRTRTKAGLWNLTYGVRLTYFDWNKETLVSPRISLGLLPAFSEHWTFRLATGFYYQAPSYKELRDTTLTSGLATVRLNRNIKSQRSIHFVLGADYSFRMLDRPFKFTVETYYKALSNLNPYSVDNMRVVYYGRNMASGYAAGLDLKLYGEFVPGTDSWITFSLMRTREKINGQWVSRPTDQRYNISLFFTDYFPGSTRWRGSLKFAFADGLSVHPTATAQCRTSAHRHISAWTWD